MTSPAFPAALDALANPGSTTETDDTGFELDIVVSRLQNIAMALEAKLGVGASTPPGTAAVLRRTAAGASAWGPVVNADVADGAIDSAKLADASIVVPDIDPFGLSALAQSNPIINGDFVVWQRGTSNLPAGYIADRWNIVNTSTAVPLASQQTNAPPVSSASPLTPLVLYCGFATADAAVAAGDLVSVDQLLEGYVWAVLAQRQFTLSFWVRATKTGKHCVAFINGGADRSYVAEYTVNASNTWEYKTVTVAASPLMSDGTWYTDNRIGLYVRFVLMAGSTFLTATPNTWIPGNFNATAGVVNDADSTSNAFQLAQVKITPGLYAAPFVPRPIAQELALCQRYCEVYTGNSVYLGSGAAMNTTQAFFWVPFKTTKRTAATVTFGASGADYGLIIASTFVNTTAISGVGVTAHSLNGTATLGSALLTPGGSVLFLGGSANAKLVISAEL
jgi:hypothetical protein